MSTSPSSESDLALARRAATAAGRAVLAYFGAEHEVRFKSVDQPVTAADLEADAILRTALLESRPDYGWLSEETVDSPDRLARSRVWVVDPIDGTNSFIEGRPEFVVSIGLVEHGEPTLAVVYNPVTDEMYHARRGAGAFLNDAPIRIGEAPATDGQGVLLASRSEIARGEFDGVGGQWQVVPLGSTAYRMVKVAEGVGHAFYSSGSKNEWDVCGAALVVAEAGGVVRQWDGRDLRFNQPNPVFQGVVCSNERLIGRLPGGGGRTRTTSPT